MSTTTKTTAVVSAALAAGVIGAVGIAIAHADRARLAARAPDLGADRSPDQPGNQEAQEPSGSQDAQDTHWSWPSGSPSADEATPSSPRSGPSLGTWPP